MFGKKLQELRERAGLSQSELATASGVPVWSVRGYEQGRREPLWSVLFKLADALGVSVEEFRTAIDTNSEPPAAKKPASDTPVRSAGRRRKAK